MSAPFSFPLPSPAYMPILREPDSFTVGLQHAGKYVKVTKATAAIVTFPQLPGAEPLEGVIEANGAGTLTFTKQTGSGISLRARGGTTVTSPAQYAVMGWKWDPTSRELTVYGDLTVA